MPLLLDAAGESSNVTSASTEGSSSSGHTPGVTKNRGPPAAAVPAVRGDAAATGRAGLARELNAWSCCRAPSSSRALASRESAEAMLRSSRRATAVVCRPSPMFSTPANCADWVKTGTWLRVDVAKRISCYHCLETLPDLLQAESAPLLEIPKSAGALHPIPWCNSPKSALRTFRSCVIINVRKLVRVAAQAWLLAAVLQDCSCRCRTSPARRSSCAVQT